MRVAAFATMVLMSCICGACAGAPGGSPPIESESEATGWAGTPTVPDVAQIADGRRIAETECAICHAIDAHSKSPNPAAPPLREVFAMNDPDNLAYRFIDALQVGHDEMPRFDFDVRGADALIAYLESIGDH